MKNRRRQQKERELLEALRFDPAHLWPALGALREVMGAPALSEWVSRHGATASKGYLFQRTATARPRPVPQRGESSDGDGSGPIPPSPVPGERAA
jgi:hypothetical protein